jgi:phage gp37-like protein
MSLKTTEFVTNNMVIVLHPPHLLDLASCDFALFHKLKIKLKGQRFETVSDIQRESQVVLDRNKEISVHDAFEECKKLWDRCIQSQGAYFEGHGSQNLVS